MRRNLHDDGPYPREAMDALAAILVALEAVVFAMGLAMGVI